MYEFKKQSEKLYKCVDMCQYRSVFLVLVVSLLTMLTIIRQNEAQLWPL